MELNTGWLWAAAAMSLVCWGIHTFVGGGQIIPRLKASDLADMPKYVLYFVWHIATIVLMAIALGFALAAFDPAYWVLGVQATILSALICMLILTVWIWRRLPFTDMPQWTVFLVMALLGAGAIWF